MKIAGSTVMLTGASAGIGLATAHRFSAEGARLALVARSAEALECLAEELRAGGGEAVAIPADLRDPAQVKGAVEQTVRRLGRLDLLINNAGQAVRGSVAKVDPEHFRQIMELNVFAPLIAMQAAIPLMRAQGGGLIINISSMVSKMRLPWLGAYAATKAALNMLSDTARVELAGDNIRVVTVLPRLTETDFARNALGDLAAWERQRAAPPTPADTAQFVAGRILEAALKEPEEQTMTE